MNNIQLTTKNILEDDKLIQKIKNKFNNDDMQIFEFARDKKMLQHFLSLAYWLELGIKNAKAFSISSPSKFNFKIYKTFKTNKDDFIVNFNEVYKYIGFTQKIHAKRLLIKEFEENRDFKILLSPKGEQDNITHGGHNKRKYYAKYQMF